MKQNKKKMALWQRITIIISSVIGAIIVAFGITIYSLWHNEISTIFSVKEIRKRNDSHKDGSLYEMEVSGGFYLEDFISQGGVSSDNELIQFITGKITKGLIPINIEAPEIGCSSFTAQTEAGEKLFARNYDFSKTNSMIVKTTGKNERHSTVSVVDLQFLGIDPDKGLTGFMDKIITLAAPFIPLDGINDAGVSVGIYMTYQGETTVPTNQNTSKPDITSTTLLRLILDYASTVEEAVEIANKYDLHDSANTSYHYMVADATGKSAILEWVGKTDATDNDGTKRELKVTYNDDDSHIGKREGESDFQWVTNFIIEPGYYEGNPESKLGEDRYDFIYEELKKTNGILPSIDEALDILKGVGRRKWNNDDGNGITVHSVVYNLTERKMIFICNENFNDPLARFEYSL